MSAKHEHYSGMSACFHNLLLAGILGCASLTTATVEAQDPVQTELAALRKSIEEQKDEIARLKNEVAHLAALLDNPRRIDPAVVERVLRIHQSGVVLHLGAIGLVHLVTHQLVGHQVLLVVGDPSVC